MEVPRLRTELGTELELQLPAYTTSHSNTRSLTHWAKPGIEPTPSSVLVRFITCWATIGTPGKLFWWLKGEILWQKLFFYRSIWLKDEHGWQGKPLAWWGGGTGQWGKWCPLWRPSLQHAKLQGGIWAHAGTIVWAHAMILKQHPMSCASAWGVFLFFVFFSFFLNGKKQFPSFLVIADDHVLIIQLESCYLILF